MKQRGLDLTRHESQPLTEKLVRQADVIFALTGAHRQAIVRRWPEAAMRTLLVQPDNTDIEDPIGHPAEVYEQCALTIEDALRKQVQALKLQ